MTFAPGIASTVVVPENQMNIVAKNSDKSTLLFHVLVGILLFLIAGCSGSNDSQSPDETDTVNTDATNADPANEATGSTDVTVVSSTTDPSNDVQDSDAVNNGTETPDSVAVDSTISEPQVSTTTRVSFDITVPAFQSNALQVRLQWGDRDISAAFVVDETWSAVDDFPVDTQNELVVTFNDDNGAITLGSFSQVFRTGANPSESFQIAAGQFDTDSWDNDDDGVSNLNELIAGTDPMVPNSSFSPSETLQPVQASLELIPDKTFRIIWQSSEGAEFYRVLENPDGVSGFSAISENLDPSIRSFDRRTALYNYANARFIVQSCNAERCVNSDELIVTGTLERAVGYLKLGTSNAFNNFGSQVSISAGGNTLAVSRSGIATDVFERVNGTWQQEFRVVAGDRAKLSADGNTLALVVRDQEVGVYTRVNSTWQEQARLQASNRDSIDRFGDALSLSGDGTTLAVGAAQESSSSIGINGDQADNSADSSGAVYIFVHSDGTWRQQAYVKASNTESGDRFGASVSLSRDGNTLAVGASGEASAATGVNGDQSDNSIIASGAVFMFTRDSSIWRQQAYIKGTSFGQNGDQFGYRVGLSANGVNLAVSSFDSSSTSGINVDQRDQEAPGSGAVFLFTKENSNWRQQAFIKASNTDGGDLFGGALSLSGDGTSLAVGAVGESSSARGIGGNQLENGEYIDFSPGAVYLFALQTSGWTQQAYIKASNTGPAEEVCRITRSTSEGFVSLDVSGDEFGASVSLSEDGETLVVGAPKECSAATGFNGDQTDNSASLSGAVYLY